MIFGEPNGQRIELFNSCWSAVPVSPELAEDPGGFDLTARLEAEFRAGLRDSNQRGREVSVQRLSGLQTPSARAALIEVLAASEERERFWAAHALLREGGLTPILRNEALEALAAGLIDADTHHRRTALRAMSHFTKAEACATGSASGGCLAWWANRGTAR